MNARTFATRVLFLAAAFGVGACLPALGDHTSGSAPAAGLAGLGSPRVEDSGARYDRDAWGGWEHHGRGCNTRETVLFNQAQPGSGIVLGKGCKPLCYPETVTADAPACWLSPYDGRPVNDPGALDIDHIVPLAEAQRSGARGWTEGKRVKFYNDPANLVAVTAKTNRSKGDSDPGNWRPPNRGHWCDYATAYVAVKAAYGLQADRSEHAALAAMLRTCIPEGN